MDGHEHRGQRHRPRSTNDRIVGVFLIGLVLLGVLWLRCAWLQVVGAHRYAEIAEIQQRSTERLRSRRGAIYDRAGHPLAISVSSPSVFANARAITDKSGVAVQVARAIDRDPSMIRRRLEKDKGFVWVARQMTPDIVPTIAILQDQGVGILEEPRRLYPHGSLAGHLLGFVDIDQRGLEGLELAFNGILQGHDGWRSTLRDAKGSQLIGPWTTQTPPVDGYDMILTIDNIVQEVAEETLAWGVKKYHAKGGSIIVMDPGTGAILAMANQPSYDPSHPTDSPTEYRRNRAITDVFEPGSTFKIVTASALLNEGRISLDEPIFCEHGAYPTVARHVLHDHQPHDVLSFHDVIKFSSNIGTAKAAQRLKPEELYRYIRAFGVGQQTGIEIPGEVRGMISPPSRWSKLSPFVIPIGQEVAVTPLQLAVITSVVANGGLRVRPYLVERFQTPDGHVMRVHPKDSPVRIITSETAKTLQEILTSVVESGTGQLANVQGLTVAGKTGTAQKLEPTGRYSHSRFVASFVGFGPVPDSHFVIVVCVDEPHPVYFGGVVSAPMFKRMVERLASYWELERSVPANVMAKLP